MPSAPRRPSYSSSSDDSEDDTQQVDLTVDEEWQDLEEDEESITAKSLFEEKLFSGTDAVNQVVTYDAEHHGVDIRELVRRFDLDTISTIKLINYIRTSVQSGNGMPALKSAEEFVNEDKYFRPVLEDDALLFSVDDILEMAQATQNGKSSTKSTPEQSNIAKIKELEEDLARLQAQFADYRNAVSTTLEERWNERGTAAGQAGSTGVVGQLTTTSTEPVKPARDDDTHYFDSYSYNDIHETMLKDTIRTDAYRDFIYANKPLFTNSTVLDIGCGTGILSMFAAKAGAKQVFAVDNSNIITRAQENVAVNGLNDTIKLVRGKVEEVHLPWAVGAPRVREQADSVSKDRAVVNGELDENHGKKVDIIISEWMGYGLLYESMLDSVISARNRLLNPSTGVMVPSHCTLHIAPLSCPDYIADSIGFWDDVYGFDMRPMTEKITNDVIARSFAKEDVISEESARFRTLDLRTVEVNELEWEAEGGKFEVVIGKDVEDGLDAWGIWFDTFFLPTRDAQLPTEARAETWPGQDERKGNAFTTGPGGKPTHWQAAMLILDRDTKKKKGLQKLSKGEKIVGSVAYRKAKDNSRALEIEVGWEVVGREEETKGKQVWFLR